MSVGLKKAFPPVVNSNARLLILGSMPGEASLAAQQYYAFGRNSFWRIMGELAGASSDLSYKQRLNKLQQANIALWDVLEQCERIGSLDSAINEVTLIANDFERFLDKWPNIKTVCFNGKSVQRLFRLHVLKKQRIPEVEMLVLPSTSPANASVSFEQKLQMWRQVLKKEALI